MQQANKYNTGFKPPVSLLLMVHGGAQWRAVGRLQLQCHVWLTETAISDWRDDY